MSHLFKKTLKISEDIINLHLCTKNFDMIYSSWDKEHDGLKTDWRTVLLPKTPKNQNVEKKEKNTEDNIILHRCTKNHNHMMYGSWDTEWEKQDFLLFWAILCLFTSP